MIPTRIPYEMSYLPGCYMDCCLVGTGLGNIKERILWFPRMSEFKKLALFLNKMSGWSVQVIWKWHYFREVWNMKRRGWMGCNVRTHLFFLHVHSMPCCKGQNGNRPMNKLLFYILGTSLSSLPMKKPKNNAPKSYLLIFGFFLI